MTHNDDAAAAEALRELYRAQYDELTAPYGPGADYVAGDDDANWMDDDEYYGTLYSAEVPTDMDAALAELLGGQR